MKHIWKPTSTDGADGKKIDPKFEGFVEIDLPKYIQRLKYLKDANFKINEKGEVANSAGGLDTTIFAVELAEKHIKKVELKHVETGDEMKKVDDLQFHPEGGEILTEIGFLVLNGPALGNR